MLHAHVFMQCADREGLHVVAKVVYGFRPIER